MLRRPLRRAAVLSLGLLLAFAGTAAADSVFGDAIIGTPAPDGSRFLGDVAPGGTVSADVRFLIVCSGVQHIDADQSVVLTGGGTAPSDGAIVSVETVTLAPLTTPWSPDFQGCPDPVPSQDGGVLGHVVMRAPTIPGMHTFTIGWSRSVTPEGTNDGSAFGRTPTSVDFTMRVVADLPPPNTPPILTVPVSFEIEGDTTGGWRSAWSVSATDAEDDPDPTPTCTPAAGPVLAPGTTTTVSCTVQDKAGAAVTKTFDVKVVDTTAPTLHDLPTDISVTTDDPDGRTVTFDPPSATDVVDDSPSVVCDPASGDPFGVGTTLVTCTARDDSGNPRTGSFHVTVTYVAPAHTASAVWLEPVASGESTFVANRGRTIPVKVNLFVDGRPRPAGDADLWLTPCDGGTTTHMPLLRGGGRWNVSLDTSSLSASCYTVTVSIDGLTAGAFTLQLRGDEVAKASAKRSVPVGVTKSTTDRPFKAAPKKLR
jgi:hypothetical protein